jgi:adenine-specific DNA methylase
MIPKECKRLAEVDFPIAVVSKHSVREKSIRHGHPSTLHLWWARRPLAACRAMLLALLFPDPCDEHCPEDFKKKARQLLPRVQGNPGPKDIDLRKALLKFIGDFANWDFSTNQSYLEVSRGLVKAAHPEETPLVVDPFAGGGSIPLEALRLGCETFASDLNPVACLILKVMLEDIPRYGRKKIKVKRQNGEEVEADGLAEALRIVGKDIKEQAEKELVEFYPPDPDGSRPIAYLWARTVRCEAPNCGAEIPLTSSFWLCKKSDRKRALRYKIIRHDKLPPTLKLEIFQPKSDEEVPSGTVKSGRASCPACQNIISADRVHSQLFAQRGGADVIFGKDGRRTGGALLLAVVTINPEVSGRSYRLAEDFDYEAIKKSQKRYEKIMQEVQSGRMSSLPTESLPTPAGKKYSEDGLYYNFFPQSRYGLETWSDFFNKRQNVALEAFSRIIDNYPENISALLLGLGKLIDLSNTVCPWEPIAECPRNVLSNGRIKPSWGYVEGVPISSSSASFEKCVENLLAGLKSCSIGERPASVEQAAAQHSPLPDESVNIWFTDPPYYDAIPYAYLSDAFWSWFKRVPSKLHQNLMVALNDSGLSPKKDEIIDDLELLRGFRKDQAKQAGIPVKDREFFEKNMTVSFREGCRVLSSHGVGCVVFAHKTTEGWEALLTGMIEGGLLITSSWPIATEMVHRLRARDSAALATSVHLVCRPRPEDAPVGDWRDVLRELPGRVRDWMERLQSEGIRGADLVFACIGPALEIFSRYSKVETAEGQEVTLAEYLEKIWEVVGRTALNQILGSEQGKSEKEKVKINGAGGALEEDARLTALFLWTLQSTNGENNPPQSPLKLRGEEKGGYTSDEGEEIEEEETPKKKSKGFNLVFDVVRRFAQPLGIHLPEWEGRIIETKKVLFGLCQ